MNQDDLRQRLTIAEFVLETVATFRVVDPVMTTLSFAVEISTSENTPFGTLQIADLIGLDRHSTWRCLQRLEGMGWITNFNGGWVTRPRSNRAVVTPPRRSERICILRRAEARLEGRPLPPIMPGPANDSAYAIFARAFVDLMRPSVGPSTTRFDDMYIVAACSVSTYGKTPLGLGKIATACRLPRSSVSRRLRNMMERGWVDRKGQAYVINPTFDRCPTRLERLASRTDGLRRALERLKELDGDLSPAQTT